MKIKIKSITEAVTHAGEVLSKEAGKAADAATKAFNDLNQANQAVLLKVAEPLAAVYQAAVPNPDYSNCVIIVTAGVAAEAAALTTSNPTIAASIGAGGGAAVAQIVCRRLFPD